VDLFSDIIFRAIFFPIGWPIVKLLTLGRYPSKGSWFAETPDAEWTAGLGLAVAVIVGMAAMRQFVIH
jgi:hypothetical protein